jgi:hypothetical protein
MIASACKEQPGRQRGGMLGHHAGNGARPAVRVSHRNI